MSGVKVILPKGFRIKDGKLVPAVYQYGTASAILARKKSKRVRVAKGPKA